MKTTKHQDWKEEFDKLMGQKERLLPQMRNVILTDSKEVTYLAIKSFIFQILALERKKTAEEIWKWAKANLWETPYAKNFVRSKDLFTFLNKEYKLK